MEGGQFICSKPDMKSHIGIYMTLGKGSPYTASCKQKLNTISSMEAELVAVDDAMGQVLWTRHFLAPQGHPIPTTIPRQQKYNTTGRNGRSSNSKRTCNINVRYFLVADKVRSK